MGIRQLAWCYLVMVFLSEIMEFQAWLPGKASDTSKACRTSSAQRIDSSWLRVFRMQYTSKVKLCTDLIAYHSRYSLVFTRELHGVLSPLHMILLRIRPDMPGWIPLSRSGANGEPKVFATRYSLKPFNLSVCRIAMGGLTHVNCAINMWFP